jgi:hypothetical protein
VILLDLVLFLQPKLAWAFKHSTYSRSALALQVFVDGTSTCSHYFLQMRGNCRNAKKERKKGNIPNWLVVNFGFVACTHFGLLILFNKRSCTLLLITVEVDTEFRWDSPRFSFTELGSYTSRILSLDLMGYI